MKTTSKILNKDFNFSAKHIGLFLDDNLWSHDKWVVTIEGQTFDYSTGIGHREVDNSKWGAKDNFDRLMKSNPKKTKENLTLYNNELEKCSKVKPLQIDDVLYSLVMDSYVKNMDFEDFCGEFGYDEDSIKASEIYKACQKATKKLRTFVPDLNEAQELFQDY